MTDTEAPSSGPSRGPAPIDNTSPDEIPRPAPRPSRAKSLRHSMADMTALHPCPGLRMDKLGVQADKVSSGSGLNEPDLRRAEDRRDGRV